MPTPPPPPPSPTPSTPAPSSGQPRGAANRASEAQPGAVYDPEAKLHALGLELPVPAKPVAAYIPAKRSGGLLYISGQVPFRNGELMAKGRVPTAVSLEVAQECARQCALNGLAAAKASLGGLDRIVSVVRLGVWVACEGTFTDQPKVGNGASELMVAIFGEAGRHARAAVGAPSLPLDAPVEVEFLFEVRD